MPRVCRSTARSNAAREEIQPSFRPTLRPTMRVAMKLAERSNSISVDIRPFLAFSPGSWASPVSRSR